MWPSLQRESGLTKTRVTLVDLKFDAQIFILGWPRIVYKFCLFLYQLDTLNFLFTSTYFLSYLLTLLTYFNYFLSYFLSYLLYFPYLLYLLTLLTYFTYFLSYFLSCLLYLPYLLYLLTYLLTHSLTHSLTPCSTVLLQKLTSFQLVKKFPAFCGTRMFITAVTSARHLFLSWASSIQSIPPHPTCWSVVWFAPNYQFRNMIHFYGEDLLAPRPTPKLEDHPLSAVRDCLFHIFKATLHIEGRSSIRNLRTSHAVVTGTHSSLFFFNCFGFQSCLCQGKG
jgi:hypothetical protein